MSNHLNEVDFAFIVDTTGSMGSLIASAQRMMVSTVKDLSQTQNIDMRFGLVEYEDHPPQGRKIAHAHEFTDDLKTVQANINKLRADGGGDGPESVLDGIKAACEKLQWRPHARRVAILVGDAPPHGCGGAGDYWPRGCPCGETIESTTALVEQTGVTLYSISLNPAAQTSFGQLAQLTGGQSVSSHDAMGHIKKLLDQEFKNVDLDREVYKLYLDKHSVEEIATALGKSQIRVQEAMSRLNQRDLLV